MGRETELKGLSGATAKMTKSQKTATDGSILAEIERLKLRLQEAEDVLDSIRRGEVDALVVSGPDGDQVYTLNGADTAYRILFETMNEGAAILGADGTVFFCNKRLSSMLNSPMETIIGQSILRFVTAADAPSFEALLNLGLKTPQQIEFRLKCHDGNIVPFYISTSPFSIEDSSKICMIVTDIRERKKAEANQREIEQRFRAIFEGAQDFIFMKDLALRYTHVNPATTKLWGVSESDMLGKTTEDFLSKKEAKTIRELDTRALSGETVEDLVTRKIRGAQMTFHEVRTPLSSGSGEITGVCVICRDVTDFHKREDTLKLEPQEYRSEAMRSVLKQAALVASGRNGILLLGESGAGKDYLAKYIHERSDHSSGPYFSINCASIPSELAESELFGYEAGAFTGANRRKRGLLELAEGGTLLLNEIGELSPTLQAKFLTFLDTRTFTRVGGEQEIRVNARILAATNRDLQNEISSGRFRADLYYRLNVVSIRVPPLRERTEDLPILVTQLLSTLANELQISSAPELSAKDMARLYNYHWPGNIRELRNVLERATILSGGGTIKVDIAGSGFCDAVSSQSRVTNSADTSTLADSMRNLSRAMIEEALTRSNGKKELAASYLGVSRFTLRRRLKKLGIDKRN
ncbi:MAG: sigma 54-interacting transcriptional regulator [Desulfomonilaceae bacterium]|jgi:PAS domain S-box-containing protein